MTELISEFVEVLVWFLIGPSRLPLLTLTVIGCTLAGTVIIKRSFRGKSIALVCVLALMFSQSTLLVLFGLRRFELMTMGLLPSGANQFFSLPFAVNLALATVGVVAAFGAALYIEFGHSRLPLTRLFPQVEFLEAPAQLVERVNRLAAVARISPPAVALVDSGMPSAFITRSRRGFVVAISVGLVESLEPEELDACIAHELSHLKNRDFLLRFVATMAKVGLFSRALSYVVEPAVYRAREHLADYTATKLMGGPATLISALSKIRESQAEMAVGSVGTACLFESLGNGWIDRLFNKQPTLIARIRALEEV